MKRIWLLALALTMLNCAYAIDSSDTPTDSDDVNPGITEYDWQSCLNHKMSDCMGGCLTSTDPDCKENCIELSSDKCKSEGFSPPS